jgi:hypothetical protein
MKPGGADCMKPFLFLAGSAGYLRALESNTKSPNKRALDALASIGGHDARVVISGLLDDRVVQGPTLKVAVRVAAAVRCRLSAVTVLPLLRHADPEVRAIACGLTRPRADVNAALIDLLTDLNANV